jgi:hypothetical protein
VTDDPLAEQAEDQVAEIPAEESERTVRGGGPVLTCSST